MARGWRAGPYTERMTTRQFDPFRLDVEVFAKESGELEGQWPLQQFDRVADAAPQGVPATDEVAWSVRGERRPLRGGEAQTWLHLRAAARVPLVCQRCLGPVTAPLDVGRSLMFVHGEDAAAALDAQTDDDVLPMARALDLRELIEDELLLALPLVPRHEVCPQPLPLPVPIDEEPADAEPNPFAVLAALKPRGATT